MANINVSTTFASDIENYIQEKTLPLVQRQLVVYQFGDMLRLPQNRGTTYTASRYDRVNLPFAPLSEGVPPVGEAMSLVQVSATAQQWGDSITVTDVAQLTIKHDLFQKAIKLIAMQMAETLERNTFNNLLAGTQINYVNTRAARASLLNTDVLNPHEIDRAFGILDTIGVPMYNGQREEDMKKPADKPSKASADPRGMEHYVAVLHPLVVQDMRENSTVATAWSYSDINRLYNNELGEWGGMRFCKSNMVPYFTGVAQVNGTGSNTGGSLTTGTFNIIVTGSVAQNGYEQLIYQKSTNISISGSAGSISVTLPSTTGYLYNIYADATGSPVHLGQTASGPTTGPYAGQAIGLAPSSVVVITGVGVARVPPAPPATGVTVFPTFIFGEGAYGQVMLDDPKFTYLKTADKSDPLNQLRVVGWKVFYGTIILNQQFFMRIESGSAFNTTFG